MNKPGLLLGTFLISLKCFGQDDLLNDNLQALVEPLNISFFKSNNFTGLQISHYQISSQDTLFEGMGDYYKLIDDSTLGQYWSTQRIHGDSKAKNYLKEDKFGNLYFKSSSNGKEYPSIYAVDTNGNAVWQINHLGKYYFFYNNNGQLVRKISDTLDAANKPYVLIEYIYTDSLLTTKIRSTFNSGEPVPTTSDTIIYTYDSEGKLIQYSFTPHSSMAFMGSYKIVRHADGATIDLIQPERKKLTRYKFVRSTRH